MSSDLIGCGEPMAYRPCNVTMISAYVPQMLAALNAVLVPSESTLPKVCYPAVSLTMLGRLLNLTEVENHWLRWAYCWSRSTEVKWPDPVLADRDAALKLMSQLWRVPLEKLTASAKPNRLRALGMLAPFADASGGQQIANWFRATERFMQLIEAPHRSHASLLNALLAPEAEWRWCQDVDSVDLAVDQQMPTLVSESFRQDQHGKALSPKHLAALIEWFTSWSLPDELFTELGGHLSAETVPEAVKNAMFRCCQQQRQLTQFELLKALYAAAE